MFDVRSSDDVPTAYPPRQEKLVYEALVAHDGRTLAPGWKSDRQAALTGALTACARP